MRLQRELVQMTSGFFLRLYFAPSRSLDAMAHSVMTVK
jgi:hypothetical protein